MDYALLASYSSPFSTTASRSWSAGQVVAGDYLVAVVSGLFPETWTNGTGWSPAKAPVHADLFAVYVLEASGDVTSFGTLTFPSNRTWAISVHRFRTSSVGGSVEPNGVGWGSALVVDSVTTPAAGATDDTVLVVVGVQKNFGVAAPSFDNVLASQNLLMENSGTWWQRTGLAAGPNAGEVARVAPGTNPNSWTTAALAVTDLIPPPPPPPPTLMESAGEASSGVAMRVSAMPGIPELAMSVFDMVGEVIPPVRHPILEGMDE